LKAPSCFGARMRSGICVVPRWGRRFPRPVSLRYSQGPVALTALATLIRPAAWRYLAGGSTGALLGRSWLAEYRDRYFAEALPALQGREVGVMRYLARALYPVTLAEPETLAARSVAPRWR
jgi:hypothetical protein